jgi:hypothetical protein
MRSLLRQFEANETIVVHTKTEVEDVAEIQSENFVT